jgi:hypothetical protein
MIGLYALVLLLIWLGVGWLLLKFWRSAKSPVKEWSKTAYYTLGVVMFLLWCWPVFGKKLYYDAQVLVMCMRDGGITVYETVELPADKFDKWGSINFYEPTNGELTLGLEYIYKETDHYIKRGSPEIIKRHDQIIRRTDKKLLAEARRYSRIGGDIPGPWPSSHYSCPDVKQAGINTFLNSVFINLKGH